MMPRGRPSGGDAGSRSGTLFRCEQVKGLLKQVEKATQVRRPGLDGVLAELTQHRRRGIRPGPACGARPAVRGPGAVPAQPGSGHNGDLLVASDAVKRRLAAAEPGRRAGKWRFWA